MGEENGGDRKLQAGEVGETITTVDKRAKERMDGGRMSQG